MSTRIVWLESPSIQILLLSATCGPKTSMPRIARSILPTLSVPGGLKYFDSGLSAGRQRFHSVSHGTEREISMDRLALHINPIHSALTTSEIWGLSFSILRNQIGILGAWKTFRPRIHDWLTLQIETNVTNFSGRLFKPSGLSTVHILAKIHPSSQKLPVPSLPGLDLPIKGEVRIEPLMDTKVTPVPS